MRKNEDRRIQKSKNSIIKAFIDLIHEKDLGEITVNDIAKKSNINRGTFYLNYRDKFDLFEKYVDELLNELIATIEISNQEKEKIKNGIRDNEPYIQFFNHFQKHDHFYKAMFSYKGGPYFYIRFIEVLKEHFFQGFKKLDVCEEHLKVKKEFLIQFIVHALFGIIDYWLKNNMSESPEKMGEQLNILLSSMSKVYLKD